MPDCSRQLQKTGLQYSWRAGDAENNGRGFVEPGEESEGLGRPFTLDV